MLPLFSETFSNCLYLPGMPFPSSMLFLSRLSSPSCSLTHLTWSSKPVFLDKSSEILTQGWPSALRIFITMFIGWLFSTFRFLRKSSIISVCPGNIDMHVIEGGKGEVNKRDKGRVWWGDGYWWKKCQLQNSILFHVYQPIFSTPNIAQYPNYH